MKVRVDSNEIDVRPEDLPAFTYSVTDLQDMGRVRGARSTTMQLPLTAGNRRTLGGASAVEDSGSRSLPFAVTDGQGGLYFDGTCVVTSRSEAGMSLVALGDNARWMQFVKDTKLRAFDFGERIEVNVGTIRDSWTNTDKTIYFPLIDYGAIGQQAVFSNVPNELIRPGVRVARILQKVFAAAGYAIEAKGSFAELWPKLVTPNTFERIDVGEETLNDLKAVFSATNPTNGSGTDPIPTTAVEDVGSHYVAPGRYAADVDGTYNVTINVDGTRSGNGSLLFILRDYDGAVNIATRVVPSTTDLNEPFTVDFGDIEVTQGMELGVFATVVGPLTFTIQDYTFTVTPLDIPYQDNIYLTPAACCQDITAQELLSRVTTAQSLIAFTQGASVQLWRYDEFFLPLSAGFTDLTGRVTGIVVKQTEEQPVAFEFEHEPDADDKLAREYGGGWADGRIEVEGGVMEERKVDVGYAATVMGNVLGGLLVPRMIDYRDSTVDVYEREDRMLVADGVREAGWVQNGDTLDQYPFAYSAASGLDGTLFGDVARYDARGTVSQYYANRVRRETGVVLECDVLWHDHEVANFNPRKAVKINDGQNVVFCYVQEITQHRFGMGRPTRTKLIPL